MATDIMNLYKHLRYGEDYPAPLADFEKVLISDLQKASNEKRLAKAKRFWDEQLDTYGEPLYSDIQGPSVLEKARKKHNDPNLRAADIERKELFVAVKDYQLEVDSMQRAINFCLNNMISPTNLLLLVIRTYLSKMNNGQEDITIENFISRRSTNDELTSGGSRTICFPCRTVIPGDTTFIDAARMIQNHQNHLYMFSGYDPELIRAEMKKRYNTPDDTTYVSVYLTYQPPMNTKDLISIYEGYGMSECSPVITTNREGNCKKGSIGKPLSNVEVKFEDGEILVRGTSVMKGYYKMEDETAETLKDGWLHTGDKGYMDEDGFIFINGRVKNLIILSNGENISPEEIEGKLALNDMIGEIIVTGEDNLLTARIYPEQELAVNMSEEEVTAALQKILDAYNKTQPTYKQLSRLVVRKNPFFKNASRKIIRHEVLRDEPEE